MAPNKGNRIRSARSPEDESKPNRVARVREGGHGFREPKKKVLEGYEAALRGLGITYEALELIEGGSTYARNYRITEADQELIDELRLAFYRFNLAVRGIERFLGIRPDILASARRQFEAAEAWRAAERRRAGANAGDD